MRLLILGGLILLTHCCVADAALVTYSYVGSAVSIPDNSSSGVNLDINVTDSLDLVTFENVSLTFNPSHTWVGDLVITLTHIPTGTTIDLINRTGKVSTSSSDFGDSSNLTGTYTFSNSTNTRIIDNAATKNDNQRVTNGTYAPTNNLFNGNTSSYSGEVIQNLTSTFSPISNLSGVWRLNVADLASGDTGTVSAFSFTVTAAAVPEPGSMLLLGGVVLAGAGWRLRRRPASSIKPASPEAIGKSDSACHHKSHRTIIRRIPASTPLTSRA